MLVLCAMLVEAEVELGLLVRVVGDSLYWWEGLARGIGGAHAKGVVAHGQVRVHFLDGIHFSTTDVFRGNCAGFVHEGYLVVDALGNQVCAAFAGGVEKVEFLPPIAVALRLEAVVARGLGLVAFEMALSARQAAGACALGLVVECGIGSAFPRGQRLVGGGIVVGRRRGSVWHSGSLVVQ